MSDPLRTTPINQTPPPADGDTERDAKIESLLLGGLDQYFAGHYAQAIDIWTRALFLDRNHARARAYIDRARSAMAEQQRESEELLHNGVDAFERGEIEAARQMLNAAVQRGGAHEVALAFLTRIDRIHAATPAEPAATVSPSKLPFRPRTDVTSRSGSKWLTAMFAVAVLAAAVIVAVMSSDRLGAWIPALYSGGGQEAFTPPRIAQEPLMVPRSAETALDRARALSASGRPYDALRALELVRPTDPLRGDADKLKEAIQRDLLTFQTLPGGVEPTSPSTSPAVATATP
jgi:tetratricopeptide (TPR) repeat protein